MDYSVVGMVIKTQKIPQRSCGSSSQLMEETFFCSHNSLNDVSLFTGNLMGATTARNISFRKLNFQFQGPRVVIIFLILISISQLPTLREKCTQTVNLKRMKKLIGRFKKVKMRIQEFGLVSGAERTATECAWGRKVYYPQINAPFTHPD